MASACDIDSVLKAMRAEHIPEATAGLWTVQRIHATGWTREPDGKLCPPDTYTALLRATDATIHAGGESVMCDTPAELRRHLEFILAARGRVLVTGLGLGCVVRGLLANPRVREIDVVERDPHVVGLVWPSMPASPRISLHLADALEYVTDGHEERWDCAWHDLWSDSDRGEPHLAVTHQRLMLALRGRVEWQGAWHFPRSIRRVLRERLPAVRAWGA